MFRMTFFNDRQSGVPEEEKKQKILLSYYGNMFEIYCYRIWKYLASYQICRNTISICLAHSNIGLSTSLTMYSLVRGEIISFFCFGGELCNDD